MNQLLPHVSQTSLGETCAFYLDYITASLPSSLHSLHHKFVTPLISRPSSASPLLRALASPLNWAASYTDRENQVPALLTLVVCAIALVVMSWRSFWRRGSPPYSNNDRYGYLTPDDIVDPPSGHGRRQDDGLEPDKLILNHRRVTYELHFPPYSINDGTLTIGQLRQSAAEVTQTANPNRIKLLYKGKLLIDDTLPCRLEGLKQQSEILCVVSEAGARTPSDLSDAERTSEDMIRPPTNLTEIAPKPDKKSKRKKKSKGKKKSAANPDDDDEASTPTELKPPPQPPRPTSASGSRSSLPPPAPNLKSFPTALDQVFALASYFHKELAPLCNLYITDPPADEKARDFEHKKLGETILAQVILKADGIEVDTDESRNARRALIKEAQAALNSMDAVNK